MSRVVKPCPVKSIADAEYDAVLFINDTISNLTPCLQPIEKALKDFSRVNPKVIDEVSVVPFPGHPCGRLIFSPTGKLNTDTADSRLVYDSAVAGITKIIRMGCKCPLICCGPLLSAPKSFDWAQREYLLLNVILGACYALYTPIEVLEMVPSKFPKATKLGVFEAQQSLLDIAVAIEEGRTIARDIGGSDPERMSAIKIVDYLKVALADLRGVTMQVEAIDAKKYPLMAAVNRAASAIPRHDGRVVYIEYSPTNPSEIDQSLFLVGKGITYDTGGADVKANGVMAGMHRDKCGAAAICGFLKTVGLLQPEGLSVRAYLAFVRNSIGANSYVADEIIISRAGKRVRVGNTDAEGRMVMADLLCEAKTKAVTAKNPFLLTIATLTGHAPRAYGKFTAVMDNGPAKVNRVAQRLQESGDKISDLVEISTIRREDYEFHQGKSEYEDILQCNNLPSSATPRGHQTPAAFLIMASGLDKHGLDSEQPLCYTHVDVAASAGEMNTIPTAAPLGILTCHFIMPRIQSV